MKSYRMAGLQAISIAAAQESRTAGRPGVKSLADSDRVRERKYETKVSPDLLGKRTVINEVTKSLDRGAGVAKETVGSKVKDSLAEGKGIHDEFVPGFTVPRKERRAPNPVPDVRWGDS